MDTIHYYVINADLIINQINNIKSTCYLCI